MHSNILVETLLNLVGNAGFYILLVLIGLSLMATAIIIERMLYYRSVLPEIESGILQIRSDLLNGITASWSPPDSGIVGPLFQTIWSQNGTPHTAKARLEYSVGQLRRDLMRRASILGTLGANAPFIGLLGTVFGIIQAFRDLAQTSGKGADAVMGGIAEALVATGMGLLVAIPCVLFYNYFARRSQDTGEQLIEVGLWLAAEKDNLKA